MCVASPLPKYRDLTVESEKHTLQQQDQHRARAQCAAEIRIKTRNINSTHTHTRLDFTMDNAKPVRL